MSDRCFFRSPGRMDTSLGYFNIRACLYDWFVRGWTVKEIADKTGHSEQLITNMLESYELDNKYVENSVSTIYKKTS